MAYEMREINTTGATRENKKCGEDVLKEGGVRSLNNSGRALPERRAAGKYVTAAIQGM
jgi:hypothetical protein